MRALAVERTQWAVGNGFFHSGSVSSSRSVPNSQVNYVYDCGALQRNQAALNREVEEYGRRVRTLGSQRADYVFISHFDFDHVSGLHLLAREVKIGRFIIPMIPVQDRIMSLARQLSNGSLSIDGSAASEFYLGLIRDPIATLASLGDDIQVDEVEPVALDETDGPPLDDDRQVEAPEILTNSELRGATEGVIDGGHSKGTYHAHVDQEIIWEWRHYVTEAVGDAADDFVKTLIACGAISGEDDLLDDDKIWDLVMNQRTVLVAAYDSVVLGSINKKTNIRNFISLMLYSGPPEEAKIRTYRTRSRTLERAEIGAWDPRPGWLGLGDADLRSRSRVADVNNNFRKQKPYVGTFAPSHHGSGKDWDGSLMDGFCPGNTFTPTTVFGASDTQWKHPHNNVIMDIHEMGGTTVIVGVEEKSRWTESLKVYVKP